MEATLATSWGPLKKLRESLRFLNPFSYFEPEPDELDEFLPEIETDDSEK